LPTLKIPHRKLLRIHRNRYHEALQQGIFRHHKFEIKLELLLVLEKGESPPERVGPDGRRRVNRLAGARAGIDIPGGFRWTARCFPNDTLNVLGLPNRIRDVGGFRLGDAAKGFRL
jgi:hypothetical protein